MIARIASAVVLFQGLYYILTGLWSLVSIKSFSRFTRYQGDYFLKHAKGSLFFVIGGFFVYLFAKQEIDRIILLFMAALAGLVAVIELYYLPRIGNPLPFWGDFAEEVAVALFALVLLIIL